MEEIGKSKVESINDINQESEDFATFWRGSITRNFAAISIGALIYLVIAPAGIYQYLSTFFLITPLLMAANKSPKNKNHRAIWFVSCWAASLGVYMAYIK